MRVHGMVVQQERLSGRGYDCHENAPNQLYLLLNALHGFLLPDFPDRCDAVQESRVAALFLLPSLLLLYVRLKAILLPPIVTQTLLHF